MTVLVAAKGGDGVVYVASDTLVTSEDGLKTGYRKKFTWGPKGRLIATAGYMRANNIINVVPEIFDVPDDAAPDLDAFMTAENIARTLFEHGYARGSNNSGNAEPITLSSEILYVTQGQIYEIDDSLSFDSYQTHTALGSGGRVALGALQALKSDHPLRKVLTAAEVAIAYDNSCGGPLDLNIITPSSLTEKKADAFIKRAFKEAGLQDYDQTEVTVYLRSFA